MGIVVGAGLELASESEKQHKHLYVRDLASR